MKLAGFFLMVAGFLLTVAALILLQTLGLRSTFILSGLIVEVVGLALIVRSYTIVARESHR